MNPTKPVIPEAKIKLILSKCYSTVVYLKLKGIRKFNTSTRINNKIIEMKESEFKDKENLNTKYSESLINI